MLKFKVKHVCTALAISTALLAAPVTSMAAEPGAKALEEGQKLAFNRSQGNCLACHAIKGGKQAGNIGPALIAMKARFPGKAGKQELYDIVYGKVSRVPKDISMMPPFGAHAILSDEQIQKIVDYIYTL